MDGSPHFVHGIFQARILQWVAILFRQGIFLTQRLNPHLLPWQVGFFFLSTEPPGKPHIYMSVSIYLYISHFKSDFLNTNDRKPIINNILLYRISTKVPCVHSVETYKESVFFPWSPLYCNSLRLFFFFKWLLEFFFMIHSSITYPKSHNKELFATDFSAVISYLLYFKESWQRSIALYKPNNTRQEDWFADDNIVYLSKYVTRFLIIHDKKYPASMRI